MNARAARQPNGHEEHVVDVTVSQMKKAETLKGDITKDLLDFVRQQEKPWQKLNEQEQEAVISRAEFIAGQIVNGALLVIASRGFQFYPCTIGKLAVDKGIEAKITLPFDPETLTKLAKVRNEQIMLVPIDAKTFMGGKKIKPDVVGSLAMPKGEGHKDGEDEAHDAETGELPPRTESLTNPKEMPTGKEVKGAADRAEKRSAANQHT